MIKLFIASSALLVSSYSFAGDTCKQLFRQAGYSKNTASLYCYAMPIPAERCLERYVYSGYHVMQVHDHCMQSFGYDYSNYNDFRSRRTETIEEYNERVRLENARRSGSVYIRNSGHMSNEEYNERVRLENAYRSGSIYVPDSDSMSNEEYNDRVRLENAYRSGSVYVPNSDSMSNEEYNDRVRFENERRSSGYYD